jgi:Flp pilus assembly protein TadB
MLALQRAFRQSVGYRKSTQMTVSSELDSTLHAMDFAQLLLAFVFLTSYALALGQMLGARGRMRAGLVALLAAIAFASMTNPWVHGALLVAMAVAGIGLFIVAVWLLGIVTARRPTAQELANTSALQAVAANTPVEAAKTGAMPIIAPQVP